MYCPFCEPTFHELSFLENEWFIAVPNRAPILQGHCMVVTRRHVERVYQLNNEELEQFFPFIRRVTQVLSKSYQTKSFDYSLQDGVEVGQTIFHLHMHIIPRVSGDLPSPGLWYAKLYGYDPDVVIDSQFRPILSSNDILKISDNLRNLSI